MTDDSDEPSSGVDRAERPVLPAGVPQRFLPTTARRADDLLYRPAIGGVARVHFVNQKRSVDTHEDLVLIGRSNPEGDVDWYSAQALEDFDPGAPAPAPSAECGIRARPRRAWRTP